MTHNRDRIRARTREGAAVPLYADHESRQAVDHLLRTAGLPRGEEFADLLASELQERARKAPLGPANSRKHSARINEALLRASKDMRIHEVETHVAVGAIFRRINILGLEELDLKTTPDRKTVKAFVEKQAVELRSKLGK